MSTELLIALFSGTTLTTLLTIGYTIWRERKRNVQKDMAGDLTLGALFRDIAVKQVTTIEAELERLQATVRELRECKDRLEARTRELSRQVKEQQSHLDLIERKYRGAQDYVRVLVQAWREVMGEHPLPAPPEEYSPDSRTIKRKPPHPLT